MNRDDLVVELLNADPKILQRAAYIAAQITEDDPEVDWVPLLHRLVADPQMLKRLQKDHGITMLSDEGDAPSDEIRSFYMELLSENTTNSASISK